jgi:hypothetical protein
MGSILASTLITNVRAVTNDTVSGAYRNEDPEILTWINEGQRALCRLKPSQSTVTATVSLVAGTKQLVPSNSHAFVALVCNTGGNAITMTDRDTLDRFKPTWHIDPAGPTENYVKSLASPREFYVYPPAEAAAQVEAQYAVPPATIAASDPIVVDDIYAAALQNYALARLYSKETEDAAAIQLAAAYMQAFTAEAT